jgi:hypothetical protein
MQQGNVRVKVADAAKACRICAACMLATLAQRRPVAEPVQQGNVSVKVADAADACYLLVARVLPLLVAQVNPQRSQPAQQGTVGAGVVDACQFLAGHVLPMLVMRTSNRSAARQIKLLAAQANTACCKLKQRKWRDSMPQQCRIDHVCHIPQLSSVCSKQTLHTSCAMTQQATCEFEIL